MSINIKQLQSSHRYNVSVGLLNQFAATRFFNYLTKIHNVAIDDLLSTSILARRGVRNVTCF